MASPTINDKIAAAVNDLRVELRFVDPTRGMSVFVRSATNPSTDAYRVKVAIVRGRVEASCTCFNGTDVHPVKPMCAHVRTLLRQAPNEIKALAGWYS